MSYRTLEIMLQIRPSKFGGSFNQPNVPTINVVVDKLAQKIKMLKVLFIIRRILHISGK